MHQIQLLKKYGLSVRGARGQHLLIDENIQRKFVELVNPQAGEAIVEIGPGLGAVTELMLRAGARVMAIEQDERFVEILKGELARDFPNLTLVHKDILKVDLRKYVGTRTHPSLRGGRKADEAISESLSFPRKRESTVFGSPIKAFGNDRISARNDVRCKVVGNIPYYITSPILLHLVKFREIIDSVYLTLQKELADRIFAQPATKAYGRLTLLIRFYSEAERAFEISRNCFSPKPNVDSSVIRLAFRRSIPDSVNETLLFKLIEVGFRERRKNILNAMTDGFDPEFTKDQIKQFLIAARIDPNSRAEALLLKDFLRLTEVVSSQNRDVDVKKRMC